jgi:hypothetical protein
MALEPMVMRLRPTLLQNPHGMATCAAGLAQLAGHPRTLQLPFTGAELHEPLPSELPTCEPQPS